MICCFTFIKYLNFLLLLTALSFHVFNWFLPFILSLITLQKQPPEAFCEKSVLWNFAKFTGKHLCQSLFFNKVKTLVQVFSCKFCEISKNNYFTEHLRVTVFRSFISTKWWVFLENSKYKKIQCYNVCVFWLTPVFYLNYFTFWR